MTFRPETALISGATAGIGEACAKIFAANGVRLILTGRRQERLETLAASLPVDCLPLCFDIRDREATQEAISSIPANWRNIDLLLNNAGLAVGKDSIQAGDIDDWEVMIDTNVKGLLYLTRAIAPEMISRGKGHIINLGSLAGKEVYAGGNVYCATKFAVDALTKSMRLDLLEHGIRVSQIAPGLVETEFSVVRFKGDTGKADAVYEGYDPLTATDIAEIIWFAASRPPHVNINDIVITPVAQGSATALIRRRKS
jgi:NADP-dependent 3-hydroxy acid dehydrogenase YdfG